MARRSRCAFTLQRARTDSLHYSRLP